MSTSPVVPRFKCKHCGIQFTKRSNWTRHESNVNVHRKPPRRRPGAASIDSEHSGSSTSGLSPTSSRVQSAPAREPEGLSTRRRSKAAEASQQDHAEKPALKLEPVHEAPLSTDPNPLKIMIRANRRKRQRVSSSADYVVPGEKLLSEEGHHPNLVLTSPAQPNRRRPPHLDARNAQFKKWVRIIRRARWIPGETAPGTPNPLPRQLVRQRAREYAANGIEPGSKIPEGMGKIYDVDWAEVLRTFDSSARWDEKFAAGLAPIEELGESSTDSDSSLWDSD
ncbi:hypothetical protein CTheo_536 [Ceratobasidium theobromae]|uniref:C2H2-type domain-containing protein n=1 Tax=Ceratobasidium theobromae TaxID=1582974 RepID=A0A5N5QWM8_9AGAM|nr:hypothetical protein CTheo_536 [Ceratobasidium theobromae]